MINRPPDVVINRKTGEVTRFRSLSEEACTAFLAPVILRMAIAEEAKKTKPQSGELK